MSEQLREAAGLGSANGTAAVTANGTGASATKPVPQPAAGPTDATPPAAGPTDATQADATQPAAGPTDAALRGAVRAAAEVAELVRDPAIRRVRVRVADVQIEVEGAEPGRDAVVGVTGDPAATGAAVSAGAGAVVAAVPGAAVAAVAPAVGPPAGTVAVTAPLMGVFYRSPGPDQPPFVEIGQRVEAGDQVAIVEAMKMMNPVVTDRGGIVRAVHVTDGEVVEYEQPLLSVEPG